MAFWLSAGAIALAVVALMARAVLRAEPEDAAENLDVSLYQDQLDAVAKDLARGTVTEEEAERLELEIKRRILDADRSGRGSAGALQRGPGMPAVLGSAVVVIAGSLGLYWVLGAPGYPDLPLKERIAAAERAKALRPSQDMAEAQVAETFEVPEPSAEIADLMDRLRKTVAERPDDLRGQELLAQYEARVGRFDAAWRAQDRVIALKGEEATADDFAVLGDLLVLAAGGYVSPEAELALSTALDQNPGQPLARYYIGLMHSQTGRPDLAFRVWLALLNQSVPEAPWVGPIRAQIERQAALAGVDYTLPPLGTAPLRGPSADDIEAAEAMSPAERMQMIEGMVGGLSERLAEEGGPPEDWARLIRALGVLGRRPQAAAIYEEAIQVFAENDAALTMLLVAARDANVAE